MKKIFVCSGHNNSDPGAVSGGYREAVENNRVVNEAINILKSQDMKGWTVVRVPHDLTLINTINWINARSTGLDDFCIEVHHNAGGGTGTESYFYGGSTQSQAYATRLNSGIVSIMKLANRGVKPDTSTRHGRLGFIRDTKPYAILPEMCFIDRASDMTVSRSRGGMALAVGVLNLIGSAYKNPIPEWKKNLTPIAPFFMWATEDLQLINLETMKAVTGYKKGQRFDIAGSTTVGGVKYYITKYSMSVNSPNALQASKLTKTDPTIPLPPEAPVTPPEAPTEDNEPLVTPENDDRNILLGFLEKFIELLKELFKKLKGE